jgi:hypothetical protein
MIQQQIQLKSRASQDKLVDMLTFTSTAIVIVKNPMRASNGGQMGACAR